MTQTKDNVQRMTEFHVLFRELDEKGQETALIVLRSLNYAQSVMYSPAADQQCSLPKPTH